ncbi:MAG: peptidylprolyl isomerase [Pseudomonadota bacterium]
MTTCPPTEWPLNPARSPVWRLPAAASVALALAMAPAPAPAQESGTPAEAEAEAGAEAEAPAEAPAPTPAPEAAAAPTPEAGDTIATVDGTELRLGEVIVLRRDLPEQYQQLPDEILARGLIEQLIDQQLLADAAVADGLDTVPATAFTIANRRRAVLAEAYLLARINEQVNEESVRARYEAELGGAEPEQEIQASHILVETQEAAQGLRDQLDGGADFAELAREHGTDGTAQRGGDLGFFTREEMVPPFAEAAFALEIGEIGGPVETQFGWHVILKAAERDREPPAFEQVAAQLTQQMRTEAQRAVIAELREAATVEITEPGAPAAAIRDESLLAPAE